MLLFFGEKKTKIFVVQTCSDLSVKNIKKLEWLFGASPFINSQETQSIFNHPNFDSFFIGEGFMFRYHPQIIKIIELLKNDSIGQIISMQSSFGKNLLTKKRFFGFFNSSKFNKKKRIFSKLLGGGAILDHGSYTVSMSLLIASLLDGADFDPTVINGGRVMQKLEKGNGWL